MSEQVIKTVENVDKLFSQIIVNGETFISDKVVEQPKPVVKPSTKTKTTTTTSTTPKASRAGEDVYAVDLNDVLHNFTDRTTKQNLTEEIRNRTEKDTAMQTELNTVKSSLNTVKASVEDIQALIPNQATKDNQLADKNTVKASVEDIQALIPNQATKDNQLADKDFVNSSVSTNTANFLGTFNTLEEIQSLTDVTNNDYAFWKTTDTLGNVVFKRYKYIADEQLWKYEYDLNNSSFTAKQWEAINSGITAELVAKIGQGGEGVPVGTIHHYIGIVAPEGYLMCDKSYNATDYPQLWAVLPDSLKNFDTGTFDIDFRELVIVGAGQNEKLNIKAHDVYNIGEFKDDQMQGHRHNVNTFLYKQGTKGPAGNYFAYGLIETSDPVNDGTNGTPRTGTTTHGKQIGLNYIIKY